MKIAFDWDEVNALIIALNTKGVSYIIGSSSSLSEQEHTVDDVCLIQRIAACGYPLVENANISFSSSVFENLLQHSPFNIIWY